MCVLLIKKKLNFGDKIQCKYTYKNGKHIIVIMSEDEKNMHSIIEIS